MFEISTFNVDKFIHAFIQNLGLKIKSPTYKKFNKISFITYIDRRCKMNQLLNSAEKVNEINTQQNWDFSSEKDIQLFIEKHTTFFDKLTYLSNTGILTSHLNNINTKILQTVKKRKKNNENTKKVVIKIRKKRKLLSPISDRDKCSFYKYTKSKVRKGTMCENSKTFYHDVIPFTDHKDVDILRIRNDNEKDSFSHNLSQTLINITQKEIETANKFLWLHTTDERIKRNVQITLYISKTSKYTSDMKNQMKYNQILCHHAILCLIEPSKNAVVLIEDNLSIVIQKYLLYGYKNNFEFQRNSKNCYIALLILSGWAKVLVNHMNTTMMRTICGILKCDVQKILVLCDPEELL